MASGGGGECRGYLEDIDSAGVALRVEGEIAGDVQSSRGLIESRSERSPTQVCIGYIHRAQDSSGCIVVCGCQIILRLGEHYSGGASIVGGEDTACDLHRCEPRDFGTRGRTDSNI